MAFGSRKRERQRALAEARAKRDASVTRPPLRKGEDEADLPFAMRREFSPAPQKTPPQSADVLRLELRRKSEVLLKLWDAFEVQEKELLAAKKRIAQLEQEAAGREGQEGDAAAAKTARIAGGPP